MTDTFCDQDEDMYIIDEYLIQKNWDVMTTEQKVKCATELAEFELPGDMHKVGRRAHLLAGDEVLLMSFAPDWISAEKVLRMATILIDDIDYAQAVALDGVSVFVLEGAKIVQHLWQEVHRNEVLTMLEISAQKGGRKNEPS